MPYSSLVIDLAPLRTLSGNNAEFMHEILEMITVQSPLLMEQINQEYADKSFDLLSKTAHKYKSSLQILGNPQLTGLAQEIEHLAYAGKASERLDELMDKLNFIYDELLEIIQIELQKLREEARA